MLQPVQRRMQRTHTFIDQSESNVYTRQNQLLLSEEIGRQLNLHRIEFACLSLGKNGFSLLSAKFNLQGCNIASLDSESHSPKRCDLDNAVFQ